MSQFPCRIAPLSRWFGDEMRLLRTALYRGACAELRKTCRRVVCDSLSIYIFCYPVWNDAVVKKYGRHIGGRITSCWNCSRKFGTYVGNKEKRICFFCPSSEEGSRYLLEQILPAWLLGIIEVDICSLTTFNFLLHIICRSQRGIDLVPS